MSRLDYYCLKCMICSSSRRRNNLHYFSSNLIPPNCKVTGIIRKHCSNTLPWTIPSIKHTYKIHYSALSLWFFFKRKTKISIQPQKRTSLEYLVTINIRDQNYTVHWKSKPSHIISFKILRWYRRTNNICLNFQSYASLCPIHYDHTFSTSVLILPYI